MKIFFKKKFPPSFELVFPKAVIVCLGIILLLLPFNFRFLVNFRKINQLEGFKEHLAISLYPFDLVLVFLIILTISFCFFNKEIFLLKIKAKDKSQLFLWVSFLAIIILTALFSPFKEIAVQNSLRLFGSFLFFILFQSLKFKKNFIFNASLIIFFSGTLQSIIALAQFFSQHSLGLSFLGESILGPDLLGVAKIETGGEKFIRAYGTFPHPNLLGAFLLFSLACGFFVFTKKDFFPKKFTSLFCRSFLVKGGIFLILGGMLVTFSRSAWLGTCFLLAILAWKQQRKITEKIKNQKKFTWTALALAVLLLALLFTPFFSSRICLKNCPHDSSFELRKIYSQAARKTIAAHPFLGTGTGTFVENLKKNSLLKKEADLLSPWEYQPVHNLYILVCSEIGIPGLLVFLVLIFSKEFSLITFPFKNKKQAKGQEITQSFFRAAFWAFAFLGFFDHYFWTLPQGQYLFFLALAIKNRFG